MSLNEQRAPRIPPGSLYDSPLPVRLKLALLWASVMFCYVYGDYFELYVPGKLQSMLDGRIDPLGPVTQTVLLGTAVLMAIPSLMVFLSIALPATASRLANLVFGLVYSIIMLLIAISSGWVFYRFFAILEVGLTMLVVWYAWTWPRASVADARS